MAQHPCVPREPDPGLVCWIFVCLADGKCQPVGEMVISLLLLPFSVSFTGSTKKQKYSKVACPSPNPSKPELPACSLAVTLGLELRDLRKIAKWGTSPVNLS